MSVKLTTIDCLLSRGVVRLEAPCKTRIADVIRTAQVPLGFACGGRGACRACVLYVQGEASPVSERERQLLSTVAVEDEAWLPRIACLARVIGPLRVRATYW